MATRFLLTNQIDTASLDAGISTYEGLPIDNVKKLSKSLVFRSTQSGSQDIEGKLTGAASKNINSFVICGHNFTENMQYSLELFSDHTFTNSLYSSGVLTVSASQAYDSTSKEINSLPIWFSTVSNVASFRLSLVGNTNKFQIYRLFMGEYIESTIGAGLNSIWSYKSITNQYRTDAGTLRSDIISPSKLIEFNLNNINELERSNLARTIASVGKRKEFFISIFKNSCANEKEVDYSGVVKLLRVPKYIEYADNIYNSRFIVETI